jgi:hypothetical protein
MIQSSYPAADRRGGDHSTGTDATGSIKYRAVTMGAPALRCHSPPAWQS